jgi:hypothetical protein
MPPAVTYRVVGVRRDKSRAVVEKGLTRPRADQLKRALLHAGSFANVVIERENLPAGPRSEANGKGVHPPQD